MLRLEVSDILAECVDEKTIDFPSVVHPCTMSGVGCQVGAWARRQGYKWQRPGRPGR